MGCVHFFDVRRLAGVLCAFGGFEFGVERVEKHSDFVGCKVDLGHCDLRCEVANVEDDMSVFRRVKKYLSWDEYKSLDKNNRLTPDGEVVPVHDDMGRELPDPVPMAPPIGWFKQPSMFDQVRQMVRGEHLRMYAEAQGAETFEEAQDFDVDDEMFPVSPYEGDFEPMEDLQARREADYRRRWFAEQDAKNYSDWKAKLEEQQFAVPARKAASGAQDAPEERPGKSGSSKKDRPLADQDEA